MKCINCGYECKDSEFHGFGGCPACCADIDGVVDPKGIPAVFHEPTKKHGAKGKKEKIMQPYQHRMLVEKSELTKKIVGLESFIAGDIFPTIPEAERVRMRWQLVFMEKYRQVLADRIAAF